MAQPLTPELVIAAAGFSTNDPPTSHSQAASFGADSTHTRSSLVPDSNMVLRFSISKTAIIGYFLWFFSDFYQIIRFYIMMYQKYRASLQAIVF